MRALSLLAACAAAVLLLAEPAAGSIADTIKELAQLRDQGVISDAEFVSAKAKLIKDMGGSPAPASKPPPPPPKPPPPPPPPPANDDDEDLAVHGDGVAQPAPTRADGTEEEGEEEEPWVGHYLPLPDEKDRPSNQDCSDDTKHTLWGVDEWIQGEVSLEAGAATGFFFFSARDAISREAAVVLSDYHTKMRSRGLHIIGVHTEMGGFAADDYLLDDLEEFIDNAEIKFSVVSVHHKYGTPPLDGEALDLEAGQAIPSEPESLWAQLKGPDEPFRIPSLLVRKNCGNVIQVGGMAVEELDQSLSAYYDHFLYPKPKGKKGKKSKKDL